MSEHAGKGLTRRPKVDSPWCAAKAREPKHNTGRAGLHRPQPLKGGHNQRGHPCRAICVRHVHPTGTQNGDPAEAGPTARGREDQCLRFPGRLVATSPPRHLGSAGPKTTNTTMSTPIKAAGHKGPPRTPCGLSERRDFPTWSPRWVLRRRRAALPDEPGRYYACPVDRGAGKG